MSLTLTPSCSVQNATDTSPLERAKTIVSMLQSSSEFNVGTVNDDTGSSGDYGAVAQPADSGETWQIGLLYQSSDDTVRLALDPQAQISDVLSPFSSASSDVSPDNAAVIPSSGTTGNWNTTVMLAAWDDALMVMFQSSDGSTMPWLIQAGRAMAPRFGNDAMDRSLDGLSVFRGSAEFAHFNDDPSSDMLMGDTNATGSQVRVAKSEWFSPGAAFDANNSGHAPFINNGRTGFGGWETPSPVPIHSSQNWSSGDGGGYLLGVTKYLFCWGLKDSVFTRLRGDSSGGLLYVGQSGNNPTPILVPWDFNVTPS